MRFVLATAMVWLTGCDTGVDLDEATLAESPAVELGTDPCAGMHDVDGLLACIEAAARPEAAGYIAPTLGEVGLLADAAAAMLDGDCTSGSELPAGFVAERLQDAGETICVLREVKDSDGDGTFDLGWGALFVRLSAQWDLHVQVPHPFYDIGTLDQGWELFMNRSVRSLAVAGSHRHAATTSEAACDSHHAGSDQSHAARSLMSAVAEAVAGDSGMVVQLHGMAEDSCVEQVFVSEGLRAEVSGWTHDLLAAMADLGASVGDPLSSECSLVGSTNVQGRILNGVGLGEACEVGAEMSSGRFAHIEQSPELRDDATLLTVALDSTMVSVM